MLSKVVSLGFKGIDGFFVNVEADVSNGLPSFNIVGLPDTNVKESRDRVLSAIKNSGFNLPSKKIVVNLSPSDIKKTGTHYDLPIALAIILASDSAMADNTNISDKLFIGELALDGTIKPVVGVLPMLISVKEKDKDKTVIIPLGNEKEAFLSGVNFYTVNNLKNLIYYLKGEISLSRPEPDNFKKENPAKEHLDLSDVKGQNFAKRAIEIAAAGFHNIIMIGPPGSGKSMLSKRISTIMPPMNESEILETTKIYSVAGLNRGELITQRPFREPHHTISDVALIGGGTNPKPGEISLAHNGVLFLDEFPEFSRAAIEALREPMESGKITVSRVRDSVCYPAKFLLVASANPCPCGYFGHPVKNCLCTPIQIKKYRAKLSGPIMDRIDIHIEVVPVKFNEWSDNKSSDKTSSAVYERVERAISIQFKRFERFKFNSSMSSSEIKKYCKTDLESYSMIEKAMDKMGYSARSVDKIMKIARTIADLDGSENIKKEHMAEALHYRTLDKNIAIDGSFGYD
ncbi:MAG: YifB family Mg chelatase-like AAA ATPase [Elusimicrobiales bacterium]